VATVAREVRAFEVTIVCGRSFACPIVACSDRGVTDRCVTWLQVTRLSLR